MKTISRPCLLLLENIAGNQWLKWGYKIVKSAMLSSVTLNVYKIGKYVDIYVFAVVGSMPFFSQHNWLRKS